MLSIAVARSADYYARLAQVGYYTAAPEKPGAWYGKGLTITHIHHRYFRIIQP
jgi:hypothetical protein